MATRPTAERSGRFVQPHADGTSTMKTLLPLPAVIVLVLFAGQYPACAEDPGPTGDGRLVEYTFDFGQDVRFESYSIVFRLHNDVAARAPLRLAVAGRVVINGEEVSGGLASDLSGFKDQYQGRRVQVGPGAFLTRWGVGHPSGIRVPQDRLQESEDEGKPFVRAVLPFEWSKGLYEYRLRRTATQQRGDKVYTWVGGFLFSHKSGREFELGSVRFEGSRLTMAATTTAFVEAADLDPAGAGVPRIRMSIWGWEVNGESVRPFRAAAFYPESAPPVVTTERDKYRIIADIGIAAERQKRRDLVQQPNGLLQVLFERPMTDDRTIRRP